MPSSKKIILASASPRRKKLLRQIGFTFQVIPSDAPETYNTNDTPAAIVQSLALRKAVHVAQQQKDALIIGADTLVVFEHKILEKPISPQQAEQMLRALRGKSHKVLTGVALVKIDEAGNKNQSHTFYEETEVLCAPISDNLIHEYIKTGSPMDKAGAYGIQDDWGALFVKALAGDYYNVVGFPVHAFYSNMKKFAPGYIPDKLK